MHGPSVLTSAELRRGRRAVTKSSPDDLSSSRWAVVQAINGRTARYRDAFVGDPGRGRVPDLWLYAVISTREPSGVVMTAS